MYLIRYLFTYIEKYLTTQLRFDIENNLKTHLLSKIFTKGNLSISDAYYYGFIEPDTLLHFRGVGELKQERLINLILSISTKKFLVSWSREVSSKKLVRVSVS